MLIEDGRGRGNSAGVNDENRLEIISIGQTLEMHMNEKGNLYHAQFDKDPDGNDDCIVYVKNSSETPMCIFGVMMYISGACEVTWKLGVEGTPSGGTDIVPVSMNAAKNKDPSGVFQHGTDITNLTGGNDVHIYKFTGAKATAGYRPASTMILEKNNTFAIYVDTAGVQVKGHVGFGYSTYLI